MTEEVLNNLTDTEKEQLKDIDFTPIDDSSEPVPQWKKDVDRINELLS